MLPHKLPPPLNILLTKIKWLKTTTNNQLWAYSNEAYNGLLAKWSDIGNHKYRPTSLIHLNCIFCNVGIAVTFSKGLCHF